MSDLIDKYNCSVNLNSAVDWQRSNAEITKKIIANTQKWMEKNQCGFWNDWIKNIFTLATANEFGLSVWAIILDEPIYNYANISPQDYPDWGFSDDSQNFFDGSFASDSTFGFKFTVEEMRKVLQLKAFKTLATGGSLEQANKTLDNIFGVGILRAFDNLDMTYSYQLADANLSPLVDEIARRDLLPRPIGIYITGVTII